jgi:hypothetical protein
MIAALVPYYGGQSDAAPSNADNRCSYLLRTITSLRMLADDVFVGVVPGEKDIPDSFPCTVLEVDCVPEMLPRTLCKWGQSELKHHYDMIYVTEADQVLSFDQRVVRAVQDQYYLVPHRLEELGPKGEGKNRGLVVEYVGKNYVLPNGSPHGPADFYTPDHLYDRYGGAFLCTRYLFDSVEFKMWSTRCIEHITGIDISFVGRTLKTYRWEDFFVEHLSGREYHEKLGGKND